MIDPNNPVARLCAQAMQAEAEGRDGDALSLCTQAWEAARDDYEACIAAHYLARQQADPRENLRWNREALQRADACAASAGDSHVRDTQEFYPSLHLNLGFSYEVLGDVAGARQHYELAAARLDDLPAGPYTDMLREGVANALRRTVNEM
jgi:hypothetical protein